MFFRLLIDPCLYVGQLVVQLFRLLADFSLAFSAQKYGHNLGNLEPLLFLSGYGLYIFP